MAQYHLGSTEKAIQNWRKALEFGYDLCLIDNIDRFYHKEIPLFHFDTFKSFFDTIIDDNPANPDLYITRALLHQLICVPSSQYDLKYHQLAIKDFKTAKSINSNDIAIPIGLAYSYNGLVMTDSAIHELKIAIQIDSLDPRIYIMKAKMCLSGNTQQYFLQSKYCIAEEDDEKFKQNIDLLMYRKLCKINSYSRYGKTDKMKYFHSVYKPIVF